MTRASRALVLLSFIFNIHISIMYNPSYMLRVLYIVFEKNKLFLIKRFQTSLNIFLFMRIYIV